MEYKNITIYQTPEEIENLRMLVRKTEELSGSVAEVGVFNGASALILREESSKWIFLFDTFEGFPDQLDESDSKNYFVGDCRGSEEQVRELFKDDKDTVIIKGKFPESAKPIKEDFGIAKLTYAFVHIDVDIYKSTKDTLEYFLPRMSKGGIILIHDYPAHDGVKKAVDELKLPVIVLGGRQAYYIHEGTN